MSAASTAARKPKEEAVARICSSPCVLSGVSGWRIAA